MKSKKDKNHICCFFHCAQCVHEKPEGESPQSYARIECGWTKKGLQVWCVRHNINIVHLDFEGQKVSVVE